MFQPINRFNKSFKFYFSTAKSHPLLLHGYDRVLPDISIPVESVTIVRFRIEICDLAGSCTVELVSVRVSPHTTSGNFTRDIGIAIRSRNVQNMLQLLVSHNSKQDIISQVRSSLLRHRWWRRTMSLYDVVLII